MKEDILTPDKANGLLAALRSRSRSDPEYAACGSATHAGRQHAIEPAGRSYSPEGRTLVRRDRASRHRRDPVASLMP